MAFGKEWTGPGIAMRVAEPSDIAPYVKSEAEGRKRKYYRAQSEAMKGVSAKYGNMSREQLESVLQDLKTQRAELVRQLPKENVSLPQTVQPKPQQTIQAPQSTGVGLFGSTQRTPQEIRRTGQF